MPDQTPKECDGKSQCADFGCTVCGNKEFGEKALGIGHDHSPTAPVCTCHMYMKDDDLKN